MSNHQNTGEARIATPAVLLFLLIIILYFNTLNVPWQFDDYGTIIRNPNVEISNLDMDSLSRAVLNKRGSLNRPVSRLTFGLNWYFHGNDVRGFHLVNIFVHLATSFFLLLTIQEILKSPKISGIYLQPEERYFIALLSAVLWAVNPIQTQSVTYIVQRMASLAAMFYIMSLWFYLRCRLAGKEKLIVIYAVVSVICFLLAIGSKQNAITLPITIILVEVIFFRSLNIQEAKKLFMPFFAIAFLSLLILLMAILMGRDLASLLKLDLYDEERSFSLLERLITEPRIIIFYLSQIFYPIPSRLSLEHDIEISTTLFSPWTTAISIILILILVLFSLFKYRRWPLISFSVLFFFLTHTVESTIVPLELVYEHRNYLPSLFLFVPISIGFLKVTKFYENKKINYVIISFGILLIIGFGTGTIIRNMVWATESSLWNDAAEKAPDSARPFHNLATKHWHKYGASKKTIEMLELALSKKIKRNSNRAQMLKNIGLIYIKLNQFENALEALNKALILNPEMDPYPYILALVGLDRYKEANTYLFKNIPNINSTSKTPYLKLSAGILLRQGRYEEAISQLKKALISNDFDNIVLLYMSTALSRIGRFNQAENFAKWAYRMGPNRVIPLFSLIEISIVSGKKQNAEKYFNELMKRVPLFDLKRKLTQVENEKLSPLNVEILAEYFSSKLEQMGPKYFTGSDGESFELESVDPQKSPLVR